MRTNTIAVTEALQASAGNLENQAPCSFGPHTNIPSSHPGVSSLERKGLLDTVDLEEEKIEIFLDTHQGTRATLITQKELIADLEDNEHEVLVSLRCRKANMIIGHHDALNLTILKGLQN